MVRHKTTEKAIMETKQTIIKFRLSFNLTLKICYKSCPTLYSYKYIEVKINTECRLSSCSLTC